MFVNDIRQENLDDAVRMGVGSSDIVPVGKSIREWIEENGWSSQILIVAGFVGTAQTFSDAQHIAINVQIPFRTDQ